MINKGLHIFLLCLTGKPCRKSFKQEKSKTPPITIHAPLSVLPSGGNPEHCRCYLRRGAVSRCRVRIRCSAGIRWASDVGHRNRPSGRELPDMHWSWLWPGLFPLSLWTAAPCPLSRRGILPLTNLYHCFGFLCCHCSN